MEAYVHDAVLDMQMSRDRLEAALDALEEADFERYVPYGSRTVRDVVAHVAGADQAWALAAQGLLKGEGLALATTVDPREARERAIERGRRSSISELRAEMVRRRRLLLSLFDLLEPKHLALKLPSFGEHNSVRERIWVGYHDRLHQADVERALRSQWYPQQLHYQPQLTNAVNKLAPDAMLYVIYSVDPTYWETPSPVPGWSSRGLLAHIATGDWVLQGHLRHILETGTVAAWPDVDAGNRERTEARRLTTWERLTDEYLSMRHETLRMISALEERHLALPIELWWMPEGSRTVLDYVQDFHTHDRAHREQLRRAMRHATNPRV